MTYEDNSPIIFYQYFDTTDTEYFKNLVLKIFKQRGHKRDIEFRLWNCYHDLPDRDGDIFSFDCIVLSSLCDKGFFRQIPEIISTDGIFEWMLDTTKFRQKLFSMPFITCFNSIICRKADYRGIDNIYDLKGQMVTPLKSMLGFYYLLSFYNYQDRTAGKLSENSLSAGAVDVINLLSDLMGGKDEVEKSAFSTFDGVERFNSGEAKYFLGFTENLRLMKKDEYIVVPTNFSNKKRVELPLFSTDVLSLGANVSGEKLLDCIDLMEIITAPDFEYNICAPNSNLSYMLPANKLAYPGLIEKDGIYNQLLSIVSNLNNCVFRFGKNYYELFPKMEQALLKALKD